MKIDHRAISLRQTEIESRLVLPLSREAEQARKFSSELLQFPYKAGLEKEILGFITEILPLDIVYDDGILAIPFQKPEWLAELPVSYGVKGGAAREIIRCVLKRKPAESPRDIDLIRRGQGLNREDEEIAKKYMPDDFMKGANVELFQQFPKYFSSRDLTVNECLYLQSTLRVLLIGMLDTLGFVIRPCRYRLGTLHRKPSLQGQLALKMLRLQSEAELRGEAWRVTGIPEEVAFSEFDLALHTGKAFERSEQHAREFIRACQHAGMLEDTKSFEEIMEDLRYLSVGEGAVLKGTGW